MFFTISHVRSKIKVRRTTAKIYYIAIFMNLRNTILTQTPHPGYFTLIFYFFLRSPINLKQETSKSTHRSWRSVSSGQSSVKGEEI